MKMHLLSIEFENGAYAFGRRQHASIANWMSCAFLGGCGEMVHSFGGRPFIITTPSSVITLASSFITPCVDMII